MIKVKGNLELKIRGWKKRVSRVENGLEIVSTQLADETIDLIREGHQKSQDPYGDLWAPLTMRSGEILSDSGRMKAAWHRKFVSSKGFTVANAAGYAKYHQFGTGIYGPKGQPIRPKNAKALAFKGPGGTIFRRSVAGTPIRKMLPDVGLPETWKDRLHETASDTLMELFRE